MMNKLTICVPFYLAEDCWSVSISDRLHEIIKRKKSIVYNGRKFSLPRRIADQLFRRTYGSYGFSYSDRFGRKKVVRNDPPKIYLKNGLFRKCENFWVFSRSDVKRCKIPLYAHALAAERVLYNSRFVDQLRESAVRHSDKSPALLAAFAASVEQTSLETREYAEQKAYYESLTRSKDQQ